MFLTVKEAATALRVTPVTVHRLIGEGLLSSVKIGRARRIPAAELQRLATEGAERRRPGRPRKPEPAEIG